MPFTNPQIMQLKQLLCNGQKTNLSSASDLDLGGGASHEDPREPPLQASSKTSDLVADGPISGDDDVWSWAAAQKSLVQN